MLFDDSAKTRDGLVLACVDCARFDPADPVARVLALASAAPYAMVLCVLAMAYATRNRPLSLVFLAGCANEAASLALKKVVREPRPVERCHELGTCGKFGMPSSHAQSVVFAFFVHLLLRRSSPSLYASTAGFPSRTVFALESVALLSAAASISFARVYLGYHTREQVAVGAALGAVAAVATRAAVLADAGRGGRSGGKGKRR